MLIVYLVNIKITKEVFFMNTIEKQDYSNVVSAIDRGGHRNHYLNRLNAIAKKVAGSINPNDIPRFICNLQNWGMFTNYEEDVFIRGFNKYEDELMKRLNEHWELPMRKLIQDGMLSVVAIINHCNDYQKRYYHSEFIDDLKRLMGIMVENEFYNFLTSKNIYSEEARIWTEKWLYENDFGELLKQIYKNKE